MLGAKSFGLLGAKRMGLLLDHEQGQVEVYAEGKRVGGTVAPALKGKAIEILRSDVAYYYCFICTHIYIYVC